MKKIILITLGVLLTTGTFAADFCDVENLNLSQIRKKLEKLVNDENKRRPAVTANGSSNRYIDPELVGFELHPSADAYNKYKGFLADAPVHQVELFSKWFPEKEVLKLLAVDEMRSYSKVFSEVLKRAYQQNKVKTADLFDKKMIEIIEEVLTNKVPAASIESRIRDYREGKPGSFQRLMGDMELNEVEMLVHGGDPLKPTPESLLGQYMKETGAKSVVRTFMKGVTAKGKPLTAQGPEKLVIAVSETSFDAYLKYFGELNNFLIHLHTPQQGTLMLAHEAKAGTYGKHSRKLRVPQEGTILPHVLLKTTEGNRASNFFDLASVNASAAREPWVNKSVKKNKTYCATGAYSSCTHWFGNIPIGDQKVKRYIFPGYVDEHASNSLYQKRGYGDDGKYDGLKKEQFEKDAEPRERNLLEIADSDELNPLVKKVWKVPGHMQLWEVLGLYKAQVKAELANPGWVALSLTGSVGSDRVPFVFLSVADHTAKIKADFDTRISAY